MGYIWGSGYNIPKAIFYLLKGEYILVKMTIKTWGLELGQRHGLKRKSKEGRNPT